jgi:hypothetical protein
LVVGDDMSDLVPAPPSRQQGPKPRHVPYVTSAEIGLSARDACYASINQLASMRVNMDIYIILRADRLHDNVSQLMRSGCFRPCAVMYLRYWLAAMPCNNGDSEQYRIMATTISVLGYLSRQQSSSC